MEWGRIGEEFRVRVNFVGFYWGVITKASIYCKISDTKTEALADTF